MPSSDQTIRQIIELVLSILIPVSWESTMPRVGCWGHISDYHSTKPCCFQPLAICLHANDLCTIHFWISVGLWIFFIVPGIIHALWFCFYRDRGQAHYAAGAPTVNA